MIIAKEETQDFGTRILTLLHNSTYDESQREDILKRFNQANESEAEDIISDLLMNQIDAFDNGSYRLKDINKQLDRK